MVPPATRPLPGNELPCLGDTAKGNSGATFETGLGTSEKTVNSPKPELPSGPGRKFMVFLV
jgi:hypothetical protein